LKVTDAQLAQALGVSRPTAGKYREKLKNLKLVEVESKESGRKREFFIKGVKY
jgi:Mn-dependent DtxR family transcriptional regulator